MYLPPEFQRTVTDLYQARGEEWLRKLPDLIAECEQRWSIRVQPHFKALSYNFAAPAIMADGSEAVLKLGVPNSELSSEIEALRLYAGEGMVRLYAADAERGAILMERLVPGTMLAELPDDDQATRIAAGIMRQLWRPVPPGYSFKRVEDWAAGMQNLRKEFDGGTGPYPRRMVEMAETAFADLFASQPEPVLLHGDLHHYNILLAQRQDWLAIDPKGVVGEPAYEVGAFLHNPFDLFDRPDVKGITARRLDILSSELGIDRQRLIRYAQAQAMLSAWWSYEDHGSGWDTTVEMAEILATLL